MKGSPRKKTRLLIFYISPQFNIVNVELLEGNEYKLFFSREKECLIICNFAINLIIRCVHILLRENSKKSSNERNESRLNLMK